LLSNASDEPEPSFMTERVVVNLLRFCIALLHREEITSDLLGSIRLLRDLPPPHLDALAGRIMAGMLIALKTNAAVIRTREEWQEICELLNIFLNQQETAATASEALLFLSSDSAPTGVINPANYLLIVDILFKFSIPPPWVSDGGTVRSNQALDMLLSLYLRLPACPVGEPLPPTAAAAEWTIRGEEWWEMWLCSLKAVRSIMCMTENRKVAMYALAVLQKALSSPDPQVKCADAWRLCFEQILFPLVTDLVKNRGTQVMLSEDEGMKAFMLLSRMFLHHLHTLASSKDFHILWLRVIGLMADCVKAPGKLGLAEMVLESLKNMLLVMQADNIFEEATKKTGQELWPLTWTVIDSFCPELREELEPMVKGKEVAAEAAAEQIDMPPPDARTGEPAPTEEPAPSKTTEPVPTEEPAG